MAVPVTDTETEHNSSTIETPLITQSQEPEQEEEEELKDTQAQLSKSLHRLECFLKLLGFCQCSVLSFTLSRHCFLLLGVSLPLIIINFSYCSNCDKYEIRAFELEILASQSLLLLPFLSYASLTISASTARVNFSLWITIMVTGLCFLKSIYARSMWVSITQLFFQGFSVKRSIKNLIFLFLWSVNSWFGLERF